MYLCADTNTFPQNVSVPIQIQYQKMYRCADTDTFSDIFDQFFVQIFLPHLNFLVKSNGIYSVPLHLSRSFLVKITKITTDLVKTWGKLPNFGK